MTDQAPDRDGPAGIGETQEHRDPAGATGAESWLAEQRADAAIAERRRTWWLRRQAEDEATLAGTLLDLAEAGIPVVVGLSAGRKLRARVQAVGADVVLLDAGGESWAVPQGAVVTVRPERIGTFTDPSGSRMASTTTLADVLAGCAAERSRVAIVALGDELVTGTVTAVGRDVVTVRGDDGSRTHVAFHSLSAVLLAGSG